MKHKKAIFWDRDGIINEIKIKNGKSLSPRKFSDFKVFPYINSLLNEMNKLGYENIIFTNQPDISRLLMDPKELFLMHKSLMENYPIKKIYHCPHSDEDNCSCRKPLPGMIETCLKEFSFNVEKCVVVGDRITDIISGHLAGITELYLLEKSYSLSCYNNKINFSNYIVISDISNLPNIIGKVL